MRRGVLDFDPVSGERLPSINDDDIEIDEYDREADAAFGASLRQEYVDNQQRKAREAYGRLYDRPPVREAEPVRRQEPQQSHPSTGPLLGEPHRPRGAPPPQWSERRGMWLPSHIYRIANAREQAARRGAQGLDRNEPVDLSKPLPRVRIY
jgi:hypothetical protein